MAALRYHLSELTSCTHQHKDKGSDQHNDKGSDKNNEDKGSNQGQDQGQGSALPVSELVVPALAPAPRRFSGLPSGRGREMLTILKVGGLE